MEFMSKEQVKDVAPSVFTTKPSNGVSDKYTHIPTERVIDDMEELGWRIVEAKEVKARKNQQQDFKNIYQYLEIMMLLLKERQ